MVDKLKKSKIAGILLFFNVFFFMDRGIERYDLEIVLKVTVLLRVPKLINSTLSTPISVLQLVIGQIEMILGGFILIYYYFFPNYRRLYAKTVMRCRELIDKINVSKCNGTHWAADCTTILCHPRVSSPLFPRLSLAAHLTCLSSTKQKAGTR